MYGHRASAGQVTFCYIHRGSLGIQCNIRRHSAYGDSNTSVKKKELSWVPFPLEKPQIASAWIHNCASEELDRSHFLAECRLHGLDPGSFILQCQVSSFCTEMNSVLCTVSVYVADLTVRMSTIVCRDGPNCEEVNTKSYLP